MRREYPPEPALGSHENSPVSHSTYHSSCCLLQFRRQSWTPLTSHSCSVYTNPPGPGRRSQSALKLGALERERRRGMCAVCRVQGAGEGEGAVMHESL